MDSRCVVLGGSKAGIYNVRYVSLCINYYIATHQHVCEALVNLQKTSILTHFQLSYIAIIRGRPTSFLSCKSGISTMQQQKTHPRVLSCRSLQAFWNPRQSRKSRTIWMLRLFTPYCMVARQGSGSDGTIASATCLGIAELTDVILAGNQSSLLSKDSVARRTCRSNILVRRYVITATKGGLRWTWKTMPIGIRSYRQKV